LLTSQDETAEAIFTLLIDVISTVIAFIEG